MSEYHSLSHRHHYHADPKRWERRARTIATLIVLAAVITILVGYGKLHERGQTRTVEIALVCAPAQGDPRPQPISHSSEPTLFCRGVAR